MCTHSLTNGNIQLITITPERIIDERGFFSETYNKNALAKIGFEKEFVQDNHSLSAGKGVVRGLHFQNPPHAQDKLVRVIHGRILDVAVDIRRGSPTYGQHVAVELSSENWMQILVPAGFAHGFCTLAPNTQIAYKATHFYAPEYDYGLRWDDPDLGIDWPVSVDEAILSEKDRHLPLFKHLDTPFEYQG